MNELKEKGTITKIDPGTDLYRQLLSEGIALLQEFSSAQWTDYNEHDPGLTILENVVWALTEILNKCDLPIADILIQHEGQKLQSGENGFFIAPDILTMSPVTFDDYRILILDRIENVKNVYITNYQGNAVSNWVNRSLRGQLKVEVELYVYPGSQEAYEQEAKKVVEEIERLFSAHRNLCESLLEVKVLEPFPVRMNFEIHLLRKSETVEKVMTEIVGIVNNWLSPSNNFYELEELLSRGMQLQQIFNGPRTNNGFVLKEELPEKRELLDVSNVIKQIARLESVASVTSFWLTTPDNVLRTGQKQISEDILIPPGKTPVLMFPKKKEETVFILGDLEVFPNMTEVKNQIAYLQSREQAKNKKVHLDEKLEIPEGTYRRIEEFSTIRKQFPNLYGIGPDGLKVGATPQRKAQVRQLQAYLLPFEQMIANGSAQLHGLYKLYDTREKGVQSYFDQSMKDMKEVLYLLSDPDEEQSEAAVLGQWDVELNRMTHRHDQQAYERLNQATSNLLMRFAEQLDTYSLRKISEQNYGKQGAYFDQIALEAKRNFVNDYGNLGYRRSAAPDMQLPVKQAMEQCALLQKLKLLMGIDGESGVSICDIIENSRLKMYRNPKGLKQLTQNWQDILSEEEGELIISNQIIFVEEEVDQLENSFFYTGHEKDLLQKVLKEGVNRASYVVKKSAGKKNVMYYALLKMEKQLELVHTAEDEQELQNSISELIRYLMRLNRETESMFLLERQLLAPPLDSNSFAFRIDCSKLIPQLKLVLCASGSIPFLERNNHVNFLSANFSEGKGLSESLRWELCKEKQAKGWELLIKDTVGKEIARSEKPYEKESDLEEDLQLLEQLSNNPVTDEDFAPEYLLYYGPHEIKESTLNRVIDFFLPNWPARFQDINFRHLFDRTVYEQIPVSTSANSFWLSLEDMKSFERIYFAWMELYRKEPGSRNCLNKQYELICFIQYLEGKQVV
ncbi:MAG: hypothetical protein EP338_08950 [Bacteroidetes bacterium]|nr:MAG: hypothetical protein EP338_08950 [Bacteroidota bacterium]